MGAATLAEVRRGALVVLIGGEGGGKSSLALQLLAQHAADVGPALYVGAELPADEAAARRVATHRGVTWRAVLTGELDRAEVRPLRRLYFVEGASATVDGVRAAIAEVQRRHPGEQGLVVFDHVHAAPSPGEGERARVAALSASLRDLAKATGSVFVAVSQTSRAGANALDRGDVVGVEAGRTGAESAQLERDAALVIAIGRKSTGADGRTARELSVGKNRMGRGDLVFAADFDGPSGAWTVDPNGKPAREHIRDRAEATDARRADELTTLIMGFVAASEAPVARKDIAAAIHRKSEAVAARVADLLRDGVLVEVASRAPRSPHWRVWTRDRAQVAGVALAPEVENP